VQKFFFTTRKHFQNFGKRFSLIRNHIRKIFQKTKSMKKISILSLVLSSLIFLTSCQVQNSKKIEAHYLDTSFFKVDTSINNVLIGEEQFNIRILRDKFDEHLERYSEKESDFSPNGFGASPVTILFTDKNNNIVYQEKFDNDYSYFGKGIGKKLNQAGRLYLYRLFSAGGSGYRLKNYFVFLQDGKLQIREMFETNELSYTVYNKNDNEILVVDGFMGVDETHFADHRYKITKYTYQDNSFAEEEIGQTKFKYSSLDNDKPIAQILSEISTKEPSLLKGIELKDFK
jgi:hypothetical protein